MKAVSSLRFTDCLLSLIPTFASLGETDPRWSVNSIPEERYFGAQSTTGNIPFQHTVFDVASPYESILLPIRDSKGTGGTACETAYLWFLQCCSCSSEM